MYNGRFMSYPRNVKIKGVNLIPNGGNYVTWFLDFSDVHYGLPYIKAQIDAAKIAGANTIGWLILSPLAASSSIGGAPALGLAAMQGMVGQIAAYIASKGMYSYPKLQILDCQAAGQASLAVSLLGTAIANSGGKIIGCDLQNEANNFSFAAIGTAYDLVKAAYPWLSVGVSFASTQAGDYSIYWGNIAWSLSYWNGIAALGLDHGDVHMYPVHDVGLADPYTIRTLTNWRGPFIIGEAGVIGTHPTRVLTGRQIMNVGYNTDCLGVIWWASVPQNEAPVPGALQDTSPSGQTNYGNAILNGVANPSDGGDYSLYSPAGVPNTDTYAIFKAFRPQFARLRVRR